MEGFVPLSVQQVCGEEPEFLAANIRRTLESPYQRFNELIGSQSGPVSIVGSAPSLSQTYPDLVGKVLACNGAISFLLDKGIVPDYGMLFDGNEVIERYAVPSSLTYLIASRCHRKVFERLKDCKVVVWHAAGDTELEPLLQEFWRMEPMVVGGSTAVLRAACLAEAMGFKDIHLFGVDGSFEGETVHVKEDILPEKKQLLVAYKGRFFRTTASFAGQFDDFKTLAPDLRDKLSVKLTIHGDGLIPHLARGMGFEVREAQLLEAT